MWFYYHATTNMGDDLGLLMLNYKVLWTAIFKYLNF